MVRDRADSARRSTLPPRTAYAILSHMAHRHRSPSGMGSSLKCGSAEAMHPNACAPRPVVGARIASRAFVLSAYHDGQSFVDEALVGGRTSLRSCRSEMSCPSLWDADRPRLAGSAEPGDLFRAQGRAGRPIPEGVGHGIKEGLHAGGTNLTPGPQQGRRCGRSCRRGHGT
jgi:hypothetical protein